MTTLQQSDPAAEARAARVADLLGAAKTLCVPALKSAVSRLAAPMDTISRYHFGWTDARGNPENGDGGKAVRPALALLSAQAAGAPRRAGTAAGAAVELVHNYSLLHDDLMDGDETRRHRATVWTVFGPAQAVLVGDALAALAPELLFEAADQGVAAAADAADAVRRLTAATRAMIDGQAMDLDFEHCDTVSLDRCLRMVDGKTSALLAASCSVGAALAGGPETTVRALERYGHHLGLAFQAVDDLLGIWGEPETTGKPRWGDLRRRKKSLPVAAALAEGGPASRQLAEALGDPAPRGRESEEQLARRADLIEEAGGRDWALAEARRQRGAALAALNEVDGLDEFGPHRDIHAGFTALADFVVFRDM